MIVPVYYNEFDAFKANWLRNLIKQGDIPPGDVDTRSIVDVSPDDLKQYGNCHFFCGLGGWALAFKWARIKSDANAWSGSCPCQPYSVTGEQLGKYDPRDLWPHMFRLMQARRPTIAFGEQVKNAIGHNWLDRLVKDVEGENYTAGSLVLAASSFGAAHRRERLYWACHPAGIGQDEFEQIRTVPGLPEPAYAGRNIIFSLAQNALDKGDVASMLDDGVSFRVEQSTIHAYGDAIVPQTAAYFIELCL